MKELGADFTSLVLPRPWSWHQYLPWVIHDVYDLITLSRSLSA